MNICTYINIVGVTWNETAGSKRDKSLNELCRDENNGVTTEYPATIVLDLTAHLVLKNDERVGINYQQLRGIL